MANEHHNCKVRLILEKGSIFRMQELSRDVPLCDPPPFSASCDFTALNNWVQNGFLSLSGWSCHNLCMQYALLQSQSDRLWNLGIKPLSWEAVSRQTWTLISHHSESMQKVMSPADETNETYTKISSSAGATDRQSRKL